MPTDARGGELGALEGCAGHRTVLRHGSHWHATGCCLLCVVYCRLQYRCVPCCCCCCCYSLFSVTQLPGVWQRPCALSQRHSATSNSGRGERGGRDTTSSRTTTRAANELSRQSLRALVMQSSALAPGTQSPEDSISQCPFLQMTYAVENPHADGSAAPGARPRYRLPRHRDPHATPRTHDNRMAGRQISRRQQTAPPHPRCSKHVNAHPHRPGARPGRPCPVPACSGQPPSGQSRFQLLIAEFVFPPPQRELSIKSL